MALLDLLPLLPCNSVFWNSAQQRHDTIRYSFESLFVQSMLFRILPRTYTGVVHTVSQGSTCHIIPHFLMARLQKNGTTLR